MAVRTTLSALSTPQITTSLTCTITTTPQAKRAAIRTVAIKHRAHMQAPCIRAGIGGWKYRAVPS